MHRVAVPLVQRAAADRRHGANSRNAGQRRLGRSSVHDPGLGVEGERPARCDPKVEPLAREQGAKRLLHPRRKHHHVEQQCGGDRDAEYGERGAQWVLPERRDGLRYGRLANTQHVSRGPDRAETCHEHEGPELGERHNCNIRTPRPCAASPLANA